MRWRLRLVAARRSGRRPGRIGGRGDRGGCARPPRTGRRRARRRSAVPGDRGYRRPAAEREPAVRLRGDVHAVRGLALVKVSQEFNAAQCTQSGSSATCTGNVIGGDKYADSYRLDLRAARAGTYSVRNVVRIVGQADADPSNNDADLAVVVGEAPLAVSGFRLSPSPPRAGRALQATLLLARGGVPARPARVVCAAKVAGKAITGRPVRLANGGRCLWSLRASAKGKRLAGSIAATAGGKTFTRRFAANVR